MIHTLTALRRASKRVAWQGAIPDARDASVQMRLTTATPAMRHARAKHATRAVRHACKVLLETLTYSAVSCFF